MNQSISPISILEAESALRQKNPASAIDICMDYIESFPSSPIGFVLLTEAYELNGDKDSADTVIFGAYELFPGNKLIAAVIKNYREKGHYRIHSETEKDIFAKSFSSIESIGFQKPQLDDLPEEIPDLTLENPDIPVSSFLAEKYLQQGLYSEAIQIFTRLLADEPENLHYKEKLEFALNQLKS